MTAGSQSSSHQAYKEAGVDLARAGEVVDIAKAAAACAHRPDISLGGIGGFSGAFRLPVGYKSPVLLAACDGVGTKLELAQQLGQLQGLGQDLVAMSVNDLLVQGAEPLVFLDYVATGRIEPDELTILLGSIGKACAESGCTLLGGETAEMPGFYPTGRFDLAGFAVGVAEEQALYPKQSALTAGDKLIGLASSGFHSNGYSLVRKLIVQHKPDLTKPLEANGQPLSQLLLEPTRLYVKPVLALLKAFPQAVRAMVHITGGGFQDNLPRVLPSYLQAQVNVSAWSWSPVALWLKQLGNLSDETMLNTFNCGIGFVLIVDSACESDVLNWLKANAPSNWQPKTIGTLAPKDENQQAVEFFYGS